MYEYYGWYPMVIVHKQNRIPLTQQNITSLSPIASPSHYPKIRAEGSFRADLGMGEGEEVDVLLSKQEFTLTTLISPQL